MKRRSKRFLPAIPHRASATSSGRRTSPASHWRGCMTASVLPILYSFRRCPYAMRARMALLVSGVPFELREVVLRNKPAEMLAASPKASVTELVLESGTVIDESIDIMRWALDRHDPEDWLSGDDTTLIARFDGAFKHHLDRYKYPDRHDSDPREHRAAGLALLEDLEPHLAADAK